MADIEISSYGIPSIEAILSPSPLFIGVAGVASLGRPRFRGLGEDFEIFEIEEMEA